MGETFLAVNMSSFVNSTLADSIADFKWRQNFCKEVIGPLAETITSVQPMKYVEVLEYDRKIREYDFIHDDEINESANPTRYMWWFYKDIRTLLYVITLA